MTASLFADARKPRLLDLFCGGGGAGTGYARAGFEVVGVDRDPQPNYPFTFIRADALSLLESPWFDVQAFDVIHASPPCQAYAGLAAKDGRHPKLIEPTRDLLRSTGLPYVIENIADARHALIDPVRVCGSSFGLHVRRHRLFESNVALMGSQCAHAGHEIRAYYGKPGWLAWNPRGAQVQKAGRKPLLRGSVAQAPADMGIDWMTWDELREAIPPAGLHRVHRRSGIPARPSEGGGMTPERDATTPRDCHVYVVARTVLPDDKPDGDCFVCRQPLRDHPKQSSSLIPDGMAYAIDEVQLDAC